MTTTFKETSGKIRNYTDLSVELKQMWDIDTVEIIPIVIGATGLIHEGFEKIKEKLDIPFDTREAQKIVILGTVRITSMTMEMHG